MTDQEFDALDARKDELQVALAQAELANDAAKVKEITAELAQVFRALTDEYVTDMPVGGGSARAFLYWHAVIYTHRAGDAKLALEYAKRALDYSPSEEEKAEVVYHFETEKIESFVKKHSQNTQSS